MSHIFLSYSRKDAEYASVFAERLRSHGATVWMDTAALAAAETWSGEIVHAIKECSAFVVLLSPDSVASHNVTKEVSLASEKLKTIVPVEISPCELSDSLEYSLAGLHRVSIFDEDAVQRSLLKLTGIETTSLAFAVSTIPDSRLRLAVLPFEDQSAGKDNDWFADGMTDELIATLGLIEQLIVNPRNDVIYYKGKHPKLSEVAADLGVRYVVGGSVQKAGDKIRIRASLSDALNHTQIWSQKYDGTFDDIFDLQDTTARAISDALKLKLTPEEEKKIDIRPTSNPDAYELYLRADALYQKKTRADFEHSYKLVEAAIALDPNFSEAYAKSAIACAEYCRLYGHDDLWLARAENAARKVFELEGESARSLWIMGLLDRLQGDIESSQIHARRAIEIDPDFSPAYNILGWSYLSLGKFDEAVNALEKAVLLSINEPTLHFNLLVVLIELGESEHLLSAAERAVPVYEKYLRKYPDNYNSAVQFVVILEILSRREEALEKAEALLLTERLDGNALYNLGCFYCGIDKVRGIDIIRKSLLKGYSSIENIRRNHFFETIECLPEYQALVRRHESHS